MQEIHERCAGLDVHKDLIVASARWKVGASVRHAVAEFRTTTTALLQLADWLEVSAVTL